MTSSIFGIQSRRAIKTVTAFLSGKRQEKFLTAIKVLQTAEDRGCFEGREAQKAGSGFYAGLVAHRQYVSGEFGEDGATQYQAQRCVTFGAPYSGAVEFGVQGVPQNVVDAWIYLCGVAHSLTEQLKAARPKPVVTAIGLSPKVTKTLTEMNLDIDLPSITPAEIEAYKVQARDRVTGDLMFAADGTTPIMQTFYRVKWTEGTQFGKSRFYAGCQACGKPIPSRRYVPIEANCRKNGRIGLWIGCDCAKNIFGVKDIGIEKE